MPISPPHLPSSMPAASPSEPPNESAQMMPNQLAEAFALFYEESKKLESQQADLQEKINQLTQELYDSNHRLGILLASLPGRISRAVRQLAAGQGRSHRQDGGRHDRSV